jgi:CRP-like cAMP-binding protein
MSERNKAKGLVIQLDETQFGAMLNALRDLVKVLAAAQIKSGSDTTRNARFLRAFGLTGTEIGDILGMTRQAVNQALKKKTISRERKKRDRKTAVATVKET